MEQVKILASARKHGVADEDIRHALRNAMRYINVDELLVVIGPDRNGAPLEIGVVEDETEDRVIHAMPARPRYWP